MPWELAVSAVALLSAGLLAGAGLALARSSRHPADIDVALQQLRAERARDKAELAELAEKMMDAGDRIARSRARVETAQQRAAEREAKQQQQPEEPQLNELEAIKFRARRLGKL